MPRMLSRHLIIMVLCAAGAPRLLLLGETTHSSFERRERCPYRFMNAPIEQYDNRADDLTKDGMLKGIADSAAFILCE